MGKRLTIEEKNELAKVEMVYKYATMYICVKTESEEEWDKVNKVLLDMKCEYCGTTHPEFIPKMVKHFDSQFKSR